MHRRITSVKEFLILKKDIMSLTDSISKIGYMTDRDFSKWLLEHTNNHALIIRTEILEDMIAMLDIQDEFIKNFYNKWSTIKMLLPKKDGSSIKESYRRCLDPVIDEFL